ncbi:MAG TPA: serine hydrolase [Saprospiraceae bacterium]|nr:serine hydrolase [Saprospiraceae bacterium]HMQ85704.1 serine hydrolase [Saprospiraceae bacterium]
MKIFLPLAFAVLSFGGFTPLKAQENLLEKLIHFSSDSLLQAVIAQPETYQLQVIYTQIDRDENQVPAFRSFYLGVDSNLYFYPASTVKFPAAVLALEKLNELSIIGLDKSTPMRTGQGRSPQTSVSKDSSAANGLPSIEHYIKKIFLVSDNDAFNRLYEFLGQAWLNRRLYEKGYQQSRIIHRLSVSGFDLEGNRYTNPVGFYTEDSLLYHQAQAYSAYYPDLNLKKEVRGKGYINSEDQLVQAPFDFRHKNFVSLQDLHDMLRAVMFPESIPSEARFRLRESDYQFLWKYMSMLPRESDYPAYPELADWDSYVKFFLFGDSKNAMPEHIRIFNKVGDAYGFLTDVAYVVDFENGVEFLLAANIHVNADGVFNDNQYEYDTIGFPVLARIGRLMYDYELKRARLVKPDLSRFKP